MAGWLRNANQRGSDRDASDGAQDRGPAGLPESLDLRTVSAPTPVSPTVVPLPMIPNAQTIGLASITPNSEFIPWAPSMPNAETVPLAAQTLAHALDQDIATAPGPPAFPAPNIPDSPKAGRENIQTRQRAVDEAPGLPGTDSWFCGFILLFYYLSDCASFVV